MNDLWSRAITLEARHCQALGGGRTLEENLALDAENARIDQLIGWCNESLRARNQILERHRPEQNPPFGRFVIRNILTKEVIAGDVDPDRVARSLVAVV